MNGDLFNIENNVFLCLIFFSSEYILSPGGLFNGNNDASGI